MSRMVHISLDSFCNESIKDKTNLNHSIREKMILATDNEMNMRFTSLV